MSGRKKMTSAKYMTNSLEIEETSPNPTKDIMFPSIYNTRIIINNTELIIIRVAL